MTEAEFAATRFFLFVALGFTWYIWPHRKLRAEALEQDLRRIRDDLFDYIWQHNLSYENTAYREMRLCFNGFIRLATTQTMGSWHLIALFCRRWTTAMRIPADFSDMDLDPGLKRKLYEAQSQMRHRVFKSLYLEGVISLVSYPVIWTIRLFKGYNPIRYWCHSDHIQRLQNLAFYVGELPISEARLVLGLDTPMM